MITPLVFATNNPHKLFEINQALKNRIHIIGLKDIGCDEDIPETAETIEGNAVQKARYVSEKYHCNCFADDTGLEIECLKGRPGVYSARYAGEKKSFEANMNKVLEEMQCVENRKARFRCVIALLMDGNLHLFEGIVNGSITTEKHGQEGFGYDPIFLPEGNERTFAEMDIEQKNLISHRGLALEKLITFLMKKDF
jgi:XTP/dITP diphosphohydrolase